MASAIPSGGALEDFSGENQDAASFNRFAAAFVYWVHDHSLSPASDTTADVSPFYRLLCAANGTFWSVPWSQNADIDMDQRDRAYQTGCAGHNHLIWRFRIYVTTVRRIYAPTRMDIRVLRVYELLCGCKSVSIRIALPVATEKRRCPFSDLVMSNQQFI